MTIASEAPVIGPVLSQAIAFAETWEAAWIIWPTALRRPLVEAIEEDENWDYGERFGAFGWIYRPSRAQVVLYDSRRRDPEIFAGLHKTALMFVVTPEVTEPQMAVIAGHIPWANRAFTLVRAG